MVYIFILTCENKFLKIVNNITSDSTTCKLIHIDSMLKYEQNYLKLESSADKFLLVHGVSEILTPRQIGFFKSSINVHSASPDFPGRDPHHYAAYSQVESYGATAHFIEKKVDSGAIIDVSLESTKNCYESNDYLQLGDKCALKILLSLINKIANGQTDFKPIEYCWGKRKTKRVDLEKYCKINLKDSKDVINKKYIAFQKGVEFKNLYIDIEGLRFRFEKII